jgi:hypothetical protein
MNVQKATYLERQTDRHQLEQVHRIIHQLLVLSDRGKNNQMSIDIKGTVRKQRKRAYPAMHQKLVQVW